MPLKGAFACSSKKKDAFAASTLRRMVSEMVIKDARREMGTTTSQNIDLRASWRPTIAGRLLSETIGEIDLGACATTTFTAVFSRDPPPTQQNDVSNACGMLDIEAWSYGMTLTLQCQNRGTVIREERFRTCSKSKPDDFHAMAYLADDGVLAWDPKRNWFELSGGQFIECGAGPECVHCLERFAIMSPVTHPRVQFTLPFLFVRCEGGNVFALGLKLEPVPCEDGLFCPAFSMVTVPNSIGSCVDVVPIDKICGSCPLVWDRGKDGSLMNQPKNTIMLGCFWNYAMI